MTFLTNENCEFDLWAFSCYFQNLNVINDKELPLNFMKGRREKQVYCQLYKIILFRMDVCTYLLSDGCFESLVHIWVSCEHCTEIGQLELDEVNTNKSEWG